MMDAFAVIRRPVVTEKSVAATQEGDVYVFEVHDDATKEDIRGAVESIWNVKVRSVRTLNVAGKPKRYRYRFPGRTRAWKKAYVRLAEGQAIDELK